MIIPNSSRFSVVVDVSSGEARTSFVNKRMPPEIVLAQLRALVNHLEKPYFENFSKTVSSTEYKD